MDTPFVVKNNEIVSQFIHSQKLFLFNIFILGVLPFSNSVYVKLIADNNILFRTHAFSEENVVVFQGAKIDAVRWLKIRITRRLYNPPTAAESFLSK